MQPNNTGENNINITTSTIAKIAPNKLSINFINIPPLRIKKKDKLNFFQIRRI